MISSRKMWLSGLLAAGLTRWSASEGLARSANAGARAPAKLKILMLGGTSFVGPAIVDAAVARGHEVTLFNRGMTNPQLFPALEKLRGNRFPELGAGLTALRGRAWDAAIDTCGYFPRIVHASTTLLAPSIAQYVYISSVAAYTRDAMKSAGVPEDAPLRSQWDPADEVERGSTYGARKALCEAVVRAVLPDRALIPRSTIMAGPRNDSDFTRYWPVRFARGGDVLAPGSGDDAVQYMDVDDLGRWIIACLENRTTGTYNAVGPAKPFTLREYLDECRRVARSDARVTWVSERFLNAHGMTAEGDLPFWTPVSVAPGFMRVDGAKARQAGLTFRPAAETIAAELAWFRTAFPTDYAFGVRPGSGITPARERELLREWRRVSSAAAGLDQRG